MSSVSGADHRPDRGAVGEADAGAGAGVARRWGYPAGSPRLVLGAGAVWSGRLAEPPRSGYNLIAWIVPGVVVVAALAGGLLTLRAMRRRGDDNPSETAGESDELQPYLAAVDRDLSLDSLSPGQTRSATMADLGAACLWMGLALACTPLSPPCWAR